MKAFIFGILWVIHALIWLYSYMICAHAIDENREYKHKRESMKAVTFILCFFWPLFVPLGIVLVRKENEGNE